jgi:hypothetical protein
LDAAAPAVSGDQPPDALRGDWLGAALGVMAAGALAFTSALILRRRRARLAHVRAAAATAIGARASHKRRELKRSLQQACERNDPQSAARALLRWASFLWPDDPPQGLGALAGRCRRQREQIEALERRLFGSNDAQAAWDGSGLWSACKDGLGEAGADQSGAPSGTDEELAPLYPRHAQQS